MSDPTSQYFDIGEHVVVAAIPHAGPLVELRGRPGVVVGYRGNEVEVDVSLRDGSTRRAWLFDDWLERAS